MSNRSPDWVNRSIREKHFCLSFAVIFFVLAATLGYTQARADEDSDARSPFLEQLLKQPGYITPSEPPSSFVIRYLKALYKAASIEDLDPYLYHWMEWTPTAATFKEFKSLYVSNPVFVGYSVKPGYGRPGHMPSVPTSASVFLTGAVPDRGQSELQFALGEENGQWRLSGIGIHEGPVRWKEFSMGQWVRKLSGQDPFSNPGNTQREPNWHAFQYGKEVPPRTGE